MNTSEFIARKYFNKKENQSVSFEELLNNDISVILGEPASGKTYQLKEYDKLNETSQFIELVGLDIEDDIIEDDIEVVLIDSIDEALTQTTSDKKLKKQLIKYIKECKKINPNVKFIVTCRFVEWKEEFEEELKKIDSEFKTYLIEDLSTEDIEIILVSNGIKKEDFWKFIDSNYLTQLLKNIMLILYIVKDFKKYQDRKFEYYDIYLEIIKEHLSFKTDNKRCDNLDKLSLDKRLKISSIIAIYLELNKNREVSIIDLDRLSSDLYLLEGIELNGENLKIVFDTSLFNGELSNTKFFHKSIQEFLSAYFIIEKKIDIEIIKKIFAYESSFYVEFEEVVIYLTNIEKKFFKHFVSFDPTIFRRHPFLNELEQKQLLLEMIKLTEIDSHKVWGKWEFIDNSTLVKFDKEINIAKYLNDYMDLKRIDYVKFSFILGLLKNNYTLDLENIVFDLLISISSSKRDFNDYINSVYIHNFEYNKRLFDFVVKHDLLLEDNSFDKKIFSNLYEKVDFTIIKVLIKDFSLYTDKDLIQSLSTDDLFILLNYLSSLESDDKNEQMSFIIFVLLIRFENISEEQYRNVIFDLLVEDNDLYEINFYIGEYEQEQYNIFIDFNLIKELFLNYLFVKKLDDKNISCLLSILKFYNFDINTLISIIEHYSIKDFIDTYSCFRMIITNVDEVLMTDESYRNHRKEIEEKINSSKYQLKRKEREEEKAQKYQVLINSFSTIDDVYKILYFNKMSISYDEIDSINKKLKVDLSDKYLVFIDLLKKAFIEDNTYEDILRNINGSDVFNKTLLFEFLFSVLDENDLKELINSKDNFRKFFIHMISGLAIYHQQFIEIFEYHKNYVIEIYIELFELSLVQSSYKRHLLDGSNESLLEKLELYNQESLLILIQFVKDMDTKDIMTLEKNDKYSLIKVLSLDEKNYDFISNLMKYDDNDNARIYFKYMFNIDLTRAFYEYRSLFNLNEVKYLKFSVMDDSFIKIHKNNLEKFDIVNICPTLRNNFINLFYLISNTSDSLSINLDFLDDDNIYFILDTYYKVFKKYKFPLGVYTPDKYDKMNHVVNDIFTKLEESNRVTVLNNLKDNDNITLRESAKYYISKLENQKLKNEDFNNSYYKEIIDSYEYKEEVFFNYEQLEKDLHEISLKLQESRHSIFEEVEDLINDRYRDALYHRKYNVSDQSRGGESETAKTVGERDLLIKNNTSGVTETILEGFELKYDNTKVIEGHYSKLINKYDTSLNEKNYMLAYVKTNSFDKLWVKYKAHFSSFIEMESNKGSIYIGFTKEKNMIIVHYFINFYSNKTATT